MIDFTIILPTFNCSKTIEKVLLYLSILAEQGVMIIINDNASNDGTREILKSYETRLNFEIYYQSENTGAESFNFMLSHVKTNFVLPIGSDDYLVGAKYLLKTLETFSNNKNYVGYCFNSKFIYGSELIADKNNVHLIGSVNERLAMFLSHPGCNSRFYGLIRTDIFKKYFLTDSYYASDLVFSCKILEQGDWFYLANVELHREPGVSSDPLRLRRVYSNKLFSVMFPPTRWMREVYSISRPKSLKICLLILLLYVRYTLSPIIHILNKNGYISKLLG
jgi:glycosyltransferase involved in cell wall biosynthesis